MKIPGRNVFGIGRCKSEWVVDFRWATSFNIAPKTDEHFCCKLLCSCISLSFFGFVKTVFTFSSLNLNLYCQLLKQINFAFFFVLYALTTRVLHTVLSAYPCRRFALIGLDFHLISNSQPRTECESMSVSVFICLMSYFKRCRTVTVFAWMNLWDCVCAWCCAQYGSNILFGTYEILCSSLWFLFRFSLSLCERQYIICRSGYHLIGVSNGVVCFANRVHYIIMVCERKSPSQPYFGRLFSVSLAQLYHAVQCSMFMFKDFRNKKQTIFDVNVLHWIMSTVLHHFNNNADTTHTHRYTNS